VKKLRHSAPRFSMKGATGAQKELQAKQAAFYDVMTESYKTTFAESQSILKGLMSSFEPVLKAGYNQSGFSTAEEAAYRTEARETVAQSHQQAEQAIKNAYAAGGDTFLPRGAESQMLGLSALSSARQNASAQLGITQEGARLGRERYYKSAEILGGAAGLMAPTGYSGAATGAGSAAGTTASEIQKANAASSPWGAIGGILGGAAGAFAGGLGTGIGKKIGGD